MHALSRTIELLTYITYIGLLVYTYVLYYMFSELTKLIADNLLHFLFNQN